MRANRWRGKFDLIMIGAFGFWLPDVLLHAIRRNNFDARDVRVVTLVMPIALLATLMVSKRVMRERPKISAGTYFLVGVWLFGGIVMSLGATFSGGGLAAPGGTSQVALVMVLSLFPIYTFMMATYDGALLALLFVTAVIVVIGAVPGTRHLLNVGSHGI